MDLSLFLAFAAGLLSFVSPCVLALVPVYLAFLGETVAAPAAVAAGPDGVRVTPAGAGTAMLAPALLFVLGFSVLFVALGTSIGLLGSALFRVPAARQLAGILVIAIGVATTGAFVPLLDRWRVGVPSNALPASRNARAVALGALVAIGWTPCIGPVLGAILTLGASSQDVAWATLLLVSYSVGLAVPFVAAAVALPRIRPLFDWLRRHHRGVQVASGLFIIGVGVLIFTNAFSVLANLFTFFI